ncbi:MAG: L,D-transpeptidase [Anaerolineales bacterium]
MSKKYWKILCFSFPFLFVFLSACGPAATPILTATPTASPIPVATATATATATEIPTPTPTAEPAWYQPLDPSLGVLKFQYAEVLNQRAKIYASLQDAVAKTGNYGYLPKFPAYVAYTTSEISAGHTFYFLPVNYGWMDGEDLQLLTPSTFTGLRLTREVTFRFGWVLAETQSANTAGAPVQTFKRYQVVHEVPTTGEMPGYIAIGADEWLPEKSVALVSPAVPAEVGPNTCRFIYANLTTQTLSVFDQCKLVFATLISSGKNSWTFEGHFTILFRFPWGLLA